MRSFVSRRPSTSGLLGQRTFHASDAPQEKHRNIPKRSFFHPRHRFWTNLENLYINGLESQPTSQFVLKYMRHLNHPLGDIYQRQTKPEIRLPTDFLQTVYYRRFPKDRYIYMQRNNPEDRQWYKLPVDRFIERTEKYVAQGMPQGAAIAQAFKDKRLDKEAVLIEFQVCKQQSEVLFGIKETNWGELIEQGSPTENILTYDPRAEEEAMRDAHSHVQNLISQREADPRRPLLKLKDLRMRWIDVINYIQSHPDSREHFDETVYFDNPDEFATSLPASLRKDLKDPKPGENTLLDDLNFQMSKWAGDMLQSFKSEGSGFWSPDSSTLVYTNESGPGLLLLTRVGGVSTPLLTDSGVKPTWSVNNQIAFTGTGSVAGSICVIPASGGTVAVLLSVPGRQCRLPAWAPDGLSLVAFCSNSSQWDNIYYIRSDGTLLTTIRFDIYMGDSLTWSPSSAWIAYTSANPSSALRSLSVIHFDGTDLQSVSVSQTAGYSVLNKVCWQTVISPVLLDDVFNGTFTTNWTADPSGTWSSSNYQLIASSTGTSDASVYTGSVGWSNYLYYIDVVFTTGDLQILFHSTGATKTSEYRLTISAEASSSTPNSFSLDRYDSGFKTSLVTGFPSPVLIPNRYIAVVQIFGTNITLDINGARVLNFNDPSNLPLGRIGVGIAPGESATISQVHVEQIYAIDYPSGPASTPLPRGVLPPAPANMTGLFIGVGIVAFLFLVFGLAFLIFMIRRAKTKQDNKAVAKGEGGEGLGEEGGATKGAGDPVSDIIFGDKKA